MGRKSTQVNALYGLTVEDLNKIASNSKSNYTRFMIQAVIMRYNGMSTSTIMKILSKSKTTVITYINKWNSTSVEAITNKRGCNFESKITDQVFEEIRCMVTN